MSGFPGSGKSTLSRIISNLTGAVIIDDDIVKSSLLKSLESNNVVADTVGKNMVRYRMGTYRFSFISRFKCYI